MTETVAEIARELEGDALALLAQAAPRERVEIAGMADAAARLRLSVDAIESVADVPGCVSTIAIVADTLRRVLGVYPALAESRIGSIAREASAAAERFGIGRAEAA